MSRSHSQFFFDLLLLQCLFFLCFVEVGDFKAHSKIHATALPKLDHGGTSGLSSFLEIPLQQGFALKNL